MKVAIQNNPLLRITKAKERISAHMGLPEVNFLRKNCILVELKLFYQTVYPPKELYWNNRITAELSTFSNIKYARPTFAVNNGTFQRTRPKLDLVLASSDIRKLATVLFNLKALIMNTKGEEPTLTTMTSVQTNEEKNDNLEQKYSSLLDRWNGKVEVHDSPFLQLQRDSNLLFAERPVRYVSTTEGEGVDISSEEFFRLEEEQCRRNYDVLVDEHSTPSVGMKDGQYGPNIIHFEPSLYHTYSSLPMSMKFWLNGLEDDETTMMNIDEKSAENLDILLHGFKGFLNKRVKG